MVKQFPLSTLPAPLARFVSETASALGCDAAFVALPALATTAAAIGTTRSIELKKSWQEPAVIWAAVVARSGSLKSPAHDAAVGPLRKAQMEALAAFETERESHDITMLQYEKALARWKGKSGGDGDPPEKPKAPTAPRIVVSDATIEALAPLLADNPRGLLLAKDELSGWARSFNQYKSGKGSDAAAWLELHRAGALIVDRKTGERRTICIPRAAVSVTGTVQPGVLQRILTVEFFESGMSARLLLAQPPELVKKWSDRTPSQAARDGYSGLLRSLLGLQHGGDIDCPEPIALPLATDARAVWVGWYAEHAKRQREADDNTAAALAKIEAYAARFALIFTLASDPYEKAVSRGAIEAGCTLADWFAAEAERVYGFLQETDEARELRELVSLIERHGGTVTARELSHAARRYRDAGAAEAALEGLVASGLGNWQTDPVQGRGRPPTRFILTPGNAGNGNTNSGFAGENGISVTVTSVTTTNGDAADPEPEPDLSDDAPPIVDIPPEPVSSAPMQSDSAPCVTGADYLAAAGIGDDWGNV